MIGILLVAFLQAPPPAQAAAADRLEFEVASVRVAPPVSGQDPPRKTGGPGSPDPGRISYRGVPIAGLVQEAHGVMPFRLSIPDSFRAKRYDIVAKIPQGATREQFRVMLQNLLADRVGLRIHRRPAQFDTYKLVVAASGPKFQETVFEPGDPARTRTIKDANGLDMVPRKIGSSARDGVLTISGKRINMAFLAGFLESDLRSPVADATGLTGDYEIILRCAPQGLSFATPRGPSQESGVASDPAPDIFQALEQQLGLKLEKTKAMLDVIVVDHVADAPSEN